MGLSRLAEARRAALDDGPPALARSLARAACTIPLSYTAPPRRQGIKRTVPARRIFTSSPLRIGMERTLCFEERSFERRTLISRRVVKESALSAALRCFRRELEADVLNFIADAG